MILTWISSNAVVKDNFWNEKRVHQGMNNWPPALSTSQQHWPGLRIKCFPRALNSSIKALVTAATEYMSSKIQAP